MSTPRIPARIEQLYETEPEWLIADPVILRGEFAAVKFGKTTKIKIGDGAKKFSELSYMVFETGALKDGINPSTPAVTPTDPISFIAETGVYPNFGGVEITGDAGYIVWNGEEWKAVNISVDLVNMVYKTDVLPYFSTDKSKVSSAYLSDLLSSRADFLGEKTLTRPKAAFDDLITVSSNNAFSYITQYPDTDFNRLVTSFWIKGAGTLILVKSDKDFSNIVELQEMVLPDVVDTYEVPLNIELLPGERLGIKGKATGVSKFHFKNPSPVEDDYQTFASSDSTVSSLLLAYGYDAFVRKDAIKTVNNPKADFDDITTVGSNNAFSYIIQYPDINFNHLVPNFRIKGAGTIILVKSDRDFSNIVELQEIVLPGTIGDYEVPLNIELLPGQRLGIKGKATGLSKFHFINPSPIADDYWTFASSNSIVSSLCIAYGYDAFVKKDEVLLKVAEEKQSDTSRLIIAYAPKAEFDDLTTLSPNNAFSYITQFPDTDFGRLVTKFRMKGAGTIILVKCDKDFSNITVLEEIVMPDTVDTYETTVNIELLPGERLGIKGKSTGISKFHFKDPSPVSDDYRTFASSNSLVSALSIAYGYDAYIRKDDLLTNTAKKTQADITEVVLTPKLMDYHVVHLNKMLSTLYAINPALFDLITEIKFDGDSLTWGQGASNMLTKTYPEQIHTDLGSVNFLGWQNFGVPGQTVGQMYADLYSEIITAFNPTSKKKILSVGGGINDLFGAGIPAETVYATMVQYHKLCHANGIETIAITLTDCNKNYGIGIVAGNIQRERYNDLLRSGWQYEVGASAIADLGADSRIGIHTGAIDTTYFLADGQHFNDNGYAVWAELIKPAIVAVSKSQTYGQPALEAVNFTKYVKSDGSLTLYWGKLATDHPVTYKLYSSDSGSFYDSDLIYSGSLDNFSGQFTATTFFIVAEATGFFRSAVSSISTL